MSRQCEICSNYKREVRSVVNPVDNPCFKDRGYSENYSPKKGVRMELTCRNFSHVRSIRFQLMDQDPRKAPSTKKQRQLIAIGCLQLGIYDETKHEMLRERFGETSSTRITQAQAEEFLAELKSRGFVVQPRVTAPRSRRGRTGIKRKPGAPVLQIVTQGELDKIQAVAGLINWRYADGLDRWMKKRFGITRIRTSNDAYPVIEGLKKMFENGMKKKHGPDWWVRVFEDPAVELYKTEHCPKDYWAMMTYARHQAAKKMASRKDAKDAKQRGMK